MTPSHFTLIPSPHACVHSLLRFVSCPLFGGQVITEDEDAVCGAYSQHSAAWEAELLCICPPNSVLSTTRCRSEAPETIHCVRLREFGCLRWWQ